ncbi:cellulase family glycosylhydrolase [Maribacter polysiphoniae]|uniref:mannan endo-1,4-beta-mannosidase n=1 Tax=Maribacter polysiphoniae TaxID=429344 RepID=A0A316DYL0_9FLAO|nr:cellulase family glycosylhydrolase [Maribacter polysiphoniae]MBD1259658.1 cellulase family glycosylhydrolase [Maribacter polysiphoniae]PWK23201.1 cellulase (glycosyl hydrolase family 5) [Maribacter polysiphoniae]
MKKGLNKNIYRAGLILSFLGVNALLLFGISSVLSYLNTGADKSSILHVESAFEDIYLPKITWTNVANEGRPMEAQNLKKIEEDYLSAWHVRNQAYANNDPYGIADYFTDSMRVKIYRIIDHNKANGTHLKTTSLEHHPELNFYSADGKLVVFTDNHVQTYTEIYKDQKLVTKQNHTSSFKIMMLLEDGFWRIRHMKEVPVNTEKSMEKITPLQEEYPAISNCKGVNYYPKDSPWDMFGANYQENTIADDFQTIRDMGLNTIRIFVPYKDFGKANMDLGKLDKLRSTLDLAVAHKLQVVVTLFDFYGDYSIQDWTLTNRHAEQIVTTFKDHDGILAWDIKNEPDLDFESRGKEKVLAWLQQMAGNIKRWDHGHPVTIGWSCPEAAIQLNDHVDFVSFHYYREVSDFNQAYQKVRQAIPNKILVLQEYGYSSYSGIWNIFNGSEERQAEYYKKMQVTLKNENLPYLFWTMHDFDHIPTGVVGRLPWRKQRQKYFGFMDIEGKQKAAFKYLTLKNKE